MAQKTAHDIKSPLSAIMLILLRIEMLNKEQSPQNSEMFDLYISRIIERIESLSRISKNFMKFVNIETLNLIKTDLSEFLNNTASMLRSGLPPDIQLDLQLSDGLPIVKGDQDAMRSVIENLVSNENDPAIAGSNSGKTIAVALFIPIPIS